MTGTVDIYSDISCPWCFIGTRRLAAVLADGATADGEPVELTVRHHPFRLHPDAPAGGIDLPAMLRERYNVDPRVMFERVESAARDVGIPLDLSKQPRAYDTTAAHTLIRHAEAKGTQAELVDAIFAAYFLQGRDISSADVLAEAAAPHGFGADEVARILGDEEELAFTRHEAEMAGRRGVRGVPFFIFNERLALSGAQPAEVFRGAIEQAFEEVAP